MTNHFLSPYVFEAFFSLSHRSYQDLAKLLKRKGSMKMDKYHYLMIIFFVTFPLLYANSQITVVKEDEKTILLKLKSYLGNTSDIHQRWNLTSSPCTWSEISCSRGFITGINLEYQYLTAIPPIICKLKNLTHLILASTFLSGAFPTVLYDCSKLQVLDISFNGHHGPLPTDIHRMSRLTTLNLNGNYFSGIIPGAVGKLSELKHLHLTGNDFEGSIPREIGNLPKLEILDASNMKKFELATIPNELGKLKNLRRIIIVNSNLIGNIPEALSGLSRIEYMVLSRNYLNGSIPGWLFRFEKLTDLYLEYNQLYGSLPIPDGELKLSRLKLSWNKLSGKIPLEYDKHSDYDFSGNFDLCTCNSSRATEYLSLCTNHKHKRAIIIAPVVVGVFVMVIFLVCLRRYILKRSKLSLSTRSLRKTHEIDDWKFIPYRRVNFTKSEILLNLTEENLIGTGGSGNVYCVAVNQNRSHVAAKRIYEERNLDNRLQKQFLAELKILSEIRHVNIVNLFCCISNEESKILVYEYMENQSLDKWLHPKQSCQSLVSPAKNVVLTWDTRLRIAVGASHGLYYMHHDCSPPIIHRDIKSSNILLDHELNAKVADFGLAKVLAKRGDTETASAVAGTFGYIAPEYAYGTKVSRKSDVYSFGVVLLELATGKEPVNKDECMNLAQWARKHCEEGNLIEDALDEEIKEPTNLKAMTTVFKLGMMCTSNLASIRPSMREVLKALLFLAISY